MLVTPTLCVLMEGVLFMKTQRGISRTTGPNTGLFVFILMYMKTFHAASKGSMHSFQP